jgi:rhodanese-related sulfurtransferase
VELTEITPEETAERIGADGDATYVDVRTVAEFAKGRPRGRAINVPIVFHHPRTGADHPNERFRLVMAHARPHDTPLIVGGDDDGRAARAARELLDAGFAQVVVMTAGLPGWRARGLPVTGDNRDGVSYVSLLTPAWRANNGAEGD